MAAKHGHEACVDFLMGCSPPPKVNLKNTVREVHIVDQCSPVFLTSFFETPNLMLEFEQDFFSKTAYDLASCDKIKFLIRVRSHADLLIFVHLDVFNRSDALCSSPIFCVSTHC